MSDIVSKRSPSSSRLRLDHLAATELDAFQRAGTIITDGKRRRPRYFDGRFLAAPDLAREQDYFISRQADLTRAGGAGVLHGLGVTRVDDTRVQIELGNGITPAGDLVVLTETITVDLADVAEMQRLDKAFGLDVVPNEPPRRRTGLFVLALRPVEYTANPIAAYPTSVVERRAIDDGEVIEAVAVTLVPYREDHVELAPQQQRALIAHRIFVEGNTGGVPAEALPIAMLQLDRGFVLWIDSWMVRREIGTEHAGIAGFGLTPRAVREAHVQQYNRQLEQLITERTPPDGGEDGGETADPRRFAATEFFRTLPPAGQLPTQALMRFGELRFSQIFFPPQMRVHMALVPNDEVIALIEEALLLPPIDLSATSEELDFSSILVLVNLPRAQVETMKDRIATAVEEDLPLDENERRVDPRTEQGRRMIFERLQPLVAPLLEPAAPGLLSRRRPIDVFRDLVPSMPTTDDRRAVRAGLRSSPPIKPSGALASLLGRSDATVDSIDVEATVVGPRGDAVALGREAGLRALALTGAEQEAEEQWREVFQDQLTVQPFVWFVRTRMFHVNPDAAISVPQNPAT